MPVFCKDCKHFVDRADPGLDLCDNAAPDETLYLVRGGKAGRYCDQVRGDESLCGRAGRWFELRKKD